MQAVIAAVAAPDAPSAAAKVRRTAAAATVVATPFLDPRPAIRDTSGHLLLKNLTLQELTEWCASVAEPSPAKRAAQMFRWMYGNGRWVRSLDHADDKDQAFSKAFKAKVAAGASLSGGVTLQSVARARDGTTKLVFALNGEEGSATGSVETVLIPMPVKQGGTLRYTACLSTQVWNACVGGRGESTMGKVLRVQ